ncbi:MAG: hypothetical protein KKB30_09740 [Proteobacteria bacterium]|nr:hypothetical protein [Pseudomonadota bacterium]MBU1717002.1 hypothetical protein [Pseudomonadota bacterium]
MKQNFLCFFLITVVLVGCAGKNMSENVAVNKGAPVVYVYPLSELNQQAIVGVLPFQVPVNMEQSLELGISALFKDALLGRRAFLVVKQLDQPYGDHRDAVRIGRRNEVDLVLAGRVNYAIDGTELGGARVDVSVRLLDTRTGDTVWYVRQAMDQPMDYPDLGLVNRLLTSLSPNRIRRSAAGPSVPNMLVAIAMDMTDVMGGARYVKR